MKMPNIVSLLCNMAATRSFSHAQCINIYSKIQHLSYIPDNLAERSKALASGASSKERGFESHSCHKQKKKHVGSPSVAFDGLSSILSICVTLQLIRLIIDETQHFLSTINRICDRPTRFLFDHDHGFNWP